MATAVEKTKPAATAERVVVRFAGDSGDGMQLTGGQFTLSSAMAGNDFATSSELCVQRRITVQATDQIMQNAVCSHNVVLRRAHGELLPRNEGQSKRPDQHVSRLVSS